MTGLALACFGAITVILSLIWLINSDQIWSDYKKKHKKKPQTTWEKLNAPNEAILKFHVYFLLPAMIVAGAVGMIVGANAYFGY